MKLNKILSLLIGSLSLVLLAACTNDGLDEVSSSLGEYVYELRLDGGVQDYGDVTRATKVWKNADVLYLRFSASGNITLGKATYGNNKWTLTTDKALAGSGSCQAVKIDNATSSNSSSVTLSPQSAVYEDRSGTWSLSGNTLNVQATLNPLLGRLRFKGISGTSFSLMGLITYTSYDISTGTFAQSQAAVSGSINSTDYSYYIYGLMANASNPMLSTNGYTMECSTTMMQAGQSGWLNYPTESGHTGWTYNPYNGHEYVDLGLSVKWATCNVGADKPEDYGDYYAWGETETKSTYDWSTYKWMEEGYSDWMHINKYTRPDNQKSGIWYRNDTFVGDNKTTLDLEDDVAHVKWGSPWRMPTATELDELLNNCTCSETTQDGKKGYLVTSRNNGNSIFLPSAGWYYLGALTGIGEQGDYWTSSLIASGSNYVYRFYGMDGGRTKSYQVRYGGLSVRPVCP